MKKCPNCGHEYEDECCLNVTERSRRRQKESRRRKFEEGTLYWCSWCNRAHFLWSNKGKKHHRFKIPPPPKEIL